MYRLATPRNDGGLRFGEKLADGPRSYSLSMSSDQRTLENISFPSFHGSSEQNPGMSPFSLARH